MHLFSNGRLASCLMVAASLAAPAAEEHPVVPTTDLAALVAQALATHPELQFYREKIAEAEGLRRSAGRWENPEVAVTGGYKRAESRSSDLSAEGAAWSVSLSQKVDFAGRAGLRKAIAARDVALAELGLEQFRITLAARVRELGFRLFAAQARQEVRRELADRFAALQAVVLQRDPAGVAPRLEARILEASALIHERQAVEADLAVEKALAELNLLRGVAVDQPVRVTRPVFRFAAAVSLPELVAAAWRWNFDLRVRELELEQQGFRVKLAARERYPDLTLEPFYAEETSFDHEQLVGIGIRLPLPLWNRRQGEVSAGEARLRQADALVQLLRRELERDIHEASVEYRARLDEMKRWPANAMERFRQAAEEGDEHYRLGALPIGTYIALQEQAMEAVESLLETQVQAMQAGQRLELLAGVTLLALEPLPNESVR